MFKRPKFMACTLCRSKFLGISFQINFMWTKSFGASMDQKCGFFFTNSNMYYEGAKSTTCSSMFNIQNILEHVIVKQCFLFACKHFLDAFILVIKSNEVPW